MPSFFSAKLVKDRIQEIGNDTPVIIIENSKDENLKEELEKKHNNVSVIIPGQNLGWGKAINLVIKIAKTEMVFVTQPDVKLINNCIQKLKECVSSFNDFTILTPYDQNDGTYKNFEVYKSYNLQKSVNKYNLEKSITLI